MTQTPIEIKKTTPAPAPSASVPAPRGTDPWVALRGEIDQLFDRFSSGFGWPSLRRFTDVFPTPKLATSFEFAAPAVDVSEDEKAFKITAELPGLSEADLELSVVNGVLVLKGEKRQSTEEKKTNYHLSERSYGVFERSFALPDSVDVDKVSAEFGKGVLVINLPKKAEAQVPVKKIEVKAAA